MSQFPSEEMENFILSDNQEGMIEISTAMTDQTYLHLLTESRASQVLTYDSFDNINNTENDDPFRFLSQESSVPVANNHVPNHLISSSETPFLEPFQNSIHTKLAKDTSLLPTHHVTEHHSTNLSDPVPVSNFDFVEGNDANPSTTFVNSDLILPVFKTPTIKQESPKCVRSSMPITIGSDKRIIKVDSQIINQIRQQEGVKELKPKIRELKSKPKHQEVPSAPKIQAKIVHSSTSRSKNSSTKQITSRSSRNSSKHQEGSKYAKLHAILASLEEKEVSLSTARSKYSKTNRLLHNIQVEVAQLMKDDYAMIINLYSASKR